MISITEFIGDNIGGLESFQFIPVGDVASIARAKDHVITELVTLDTGKAWLDAYVTLGSLAYSEGKNKTIHGNHYNRSLVGFVPKDTEALAELFDEMGDVRFIIDYTDNNGVRKLIGSLDSPLVFSSQLSTGNDAAARNGHFITFSGNSPHKAYIYDPAAGSGSASGS